ncbi:MAG: (Fe-S)-binding protein [Solirubrobacteraceae bacterium]
MRVGLFVTCVTDTLFPEAGRATVELLERLGHTVVFDPEQTCCGQMHANSGYEPEAAALMARFLRVFGDSSLDAIVSPSASCVAMVRHQYPRLAQTAGDPGLAAAVAAVGQRVFELSEFLVTRLGVEDVGASYPHRVTYHSSCHSLRLLRVGEAPLRLLRNVRDLELVELSEADSCCGFGGTFAIKNADTSAAMLADKLRAIEVTGAEVCTSLDSSCLLHIGGGLDRQRAGVATVHLAEILASREQR